MITLDDKLDIFYKLVFKEEEEKCKKTLEELEEKNKVMIESKKSELEKKKKEIIKRKALLAENQKNEMISKSTQSNREKILGKREEILEDLIKSLENRAREFVLSKDYDSYILNKINKTIKDIDEKEIVISLIEGDKLKLQNSIIKIGEENNRTILFGTIDKDKIGGFILSDNDKTYNLDNSFKTIIEENKYLIGKRLYSSLEKVGGLNV